MERLRQSQDRRHLCHDTEPAQKRSKSKKSFLHSVQPLTEPPHVARCRLWEKRRYGNHHHGKLHPPTKEQLPLGFIQDWVTWKPLYRLRTGIGRSKVHMQKWDYTEDKNVNCDCGTPRTRSLLLQCVNLREHCSPEVLMAASERVLQCAKLWANIQCRYELQTRKKKTKTKFQQNWSNQGEKQ